MSDVLKALDFTPLFGASIRLAGKKYAEEGRVSNYNAPQKLDHKN